MNAPERILLHDTQFVEDLVRDIALAFGSHREVRHFHYKAENFESMHNHSTYAELWGAGSAH
jgi:GTP cyclohydrolase IB